MDKEKPKIRFSWKESSLICELFGCWTILESHEQVICKWREIINSEKFSGVTSCSFCFPDNEPWDSSLIVFLKQANHDLIDRKTSFDGTCLPRKVRKLLDFKIISNKSSLIETKDDRISTGILIYITGAKLLPFFTFWGKWWIALFRLPFGRSHMRIEDFLLLCRDCGAMGLPIITLISFLTGLTMAFVGSVQLQKFNATIYVADLVSLAMVREMGALMVAIVLAGRTGASYAAELGSMKLSEEIDSLRTFGISVMEFLILPRVLAILIMTPLLTLYADVVGILGGLTVGVQIMDFSISHYMEQTQSALVEMWEVYSGLWKSVAFGLIVGLVGCFKGLNAGSNSSELGKAVTSSVVLSITLIVVCDAFFETIFSLVGLR